MIYSGIDLDIFAPATNQKALKKELNLGEGFLILGVAGVWPKQKGLMISLKSVSKLTRTITLFW